MGYTMTEKILARTAGLATVNAGDEVQVKPDFVLAYDFPGYTDRYFKEMESEFQVIQVKEPERFGVLIDHMVPAITPDEEQFHKETRDWATRNGVEVFERRGIGHQVAAEVGYAVPGALAVHFDPHISQLGTFGTLALGIHRNMLEAYVQDTVSLRVPETVRVDFIGQLQPGVMARDVLNHLVKTLGPSACQFCVMELAGSGLASLSVEGLQTITGLAMFTGAISAIVAPDAVRLDYARSRSRKVLEPVYSDTDARYRAVHTIDLGTIEPLIVIPPSSAGTRDLTDYLGLDVHVGYLGSCASGRLEDLRIAAQILKGRTLAPGFSLYVVPTSQQIMATAAKEGLLTTLVEAGAFISSPSCDYCYGRIGTMNAGQRAVSTGTLNVRGRMGSSDSEIYLCSAAAVAAAAIEGKVADPRHYL
jgi:3-isopropylmalate/(R)-2-methylmalate dehydratase large subunit